MEAVGHFAARFVERSGGGAVEDETAAVEVDEDREFGLRGDAPWLEETDEGFVVWV